LQKVRVEGVWEEWLHFFIEGVVQIANQASETAIALNRLFDEDRQRIQSLGTSSGTATLVHLHLQANPISSIGAISKATSRTATAVMTALKNLEALGIVHEGTGRKRNQVFFYQRCLDIIGSGTEPLP
jgi:Fic family protein